MRFTGSWRTGPMRRPANARTRLRKAGLSRSAAGGDGQWRIAVEEIPGQEYRTQRYRFITPKGELTMVLQSNEHTAWVTEHLIKEKRDVELLGEFMPAPKCDVAAVNREVEAFGERGIVRGHICCFECSASRAAGRMRLAWWASRS